MLHPLNALRTIHTCNDGPAVTTKPTWHTPTLKQGVPALLGAAVINVFGAPLLPPQEGLFERAMFTHTSCCRNLFVLRTMLQKYCDRGQHHKEQRPRHMKDQMLADQSWHH